MSAANTDKITDVRNGARPNSARVTSARVGASTTLNCDSLTGWPTASKVHFVTYQIDSNSNPVSGTQLDCSGIVVSNTITSLSVKDGVDGGNAIGDVVEMLPTASWGQDLADALTVEHDRTGAHTTTLLGRIYPIGCIYIETTGTNPNTTFGFGTWTAFGAGRTLMGVGTSDAAYAAGATGGESTHVLTTPEIPAHVHGFNNLAKVPSTAPDSNRFAIAVGGTDNTAVTTNNAGGDGAHNNLPPYIVTYFWKRTA